MKIREIAEILQAKVLTSEESIDDIDVVTACGSDMMSDVLAFSHSHGVLLTGLCNPQVIRTAEMMDMSCVAFVRGKNPDALSLKLASEKGIVVLTTSLSMFHACGRLYAKGFNKEESC